MSDSDERAWGGVSDMMRKAVFAGLGALFMTEESIKKYVSEAKLPKNIGKYVLDNAQKGKEELFQFIARELADVITRSELPEEAVRFLNEHKIRVAAEIEFVKRQSPDDSKPEIVAHIVKRDEQPPK